MPSDEPGRLALPGEGAPEPRPLLAARRGAGRRAGRLAQAGGYGKRTEARARKAMPADLRDVGDLLLEAMRDVRAGSLTPATAHALAALSRAYVGVHEVAATDARLSQIEEMLKGMTA